MQTCLNLSGIAHPKKAILAFGINETGVATPDGYGVNGCNNNPLFPDACEDCGSDAFIAFRRWTKLMNLTSDNYTIVTNSSAIPDLNFSDYSMIYLPSQKAVAQCSNFTYTLCDIETALNNRRDDILDYVNNQRGSIFALEQSVIP